MLAFDDKRWAFLSGGYQIAVDFRPLLKAVRTAVDPESAWQALWEEAYHQGEVGVGSYAILPWLVDFHRARPSTHTYVIAAAVETAKEKNGPAIPEWLVDGYAQALADLKVMGLADLSTEVEPQAVRSILGFLAASFGLLTHSLMLFEMEEDVQELLDGGGRVESVFQPRQAHADELHVWHFGGHETVSNLAELRIVLARRLGSGVNEFWLSGKQRHPTLSILVNGPAYVVHFIPSGHPGFISMNSVRSPGTLIFHTQRFGERIEVLSYHAVSRAQALAAAAEFFRDPTSRPDGLAWLEL